MFPYVGTLLVERYVPYGNVPLYENVSVDRTSEKILF